VDRGNEAWISGFPEMGMSRLMIASTPVIPAKRSASRNPARFGANDCVSRKDGLDSRPGLLSAGVTFFRGNDENPHANAEVPTSVFALRNSTFEL
jgi:hypothetical protein